jgi:hypothetical protein
LSNVVLLKKAAKIMVSMEVGMYPHHTLHYVRDSKHHFGAHIVIVDFFAAHPFVIVTKYKLIKNISTLIYECK